MAEEEVTDLTEEGDGQDALPPPEGEAGADGDSKKKKKEKKEKEPKPPKEKKEGEEKEGSSAGIIVALLLLALLLIGGIVTALYFNMFSSRAIAADFVREPLIKFFIWLDPGFNSIDEELRTAALARESRLNAREQRLNDREEELVQRELSLEAMEAQLERFNVELEKREQDFNEAFDKAVPLYMRNMTPQELADMQSISDTYRRMSPQEAAEIMINLRKTPEDVAGILYFMTESNRAAILTAFAPEFAAAVTDVHLYSYPEP